jgi:UDP-glucuronate decarboxylase
VSFTKSGLKTIRASGRPDVSLAKDLISWTPNIPLKEDLSRTIEYFDDLLSKGMTGKTAE